MPDHAAAANPHTAIAPLPADDLRRTMLAADAEDPALTHIGLAGDTYTLTIPAAATAGAYCLFDMHIPHGGGPAPHRHDFEESFIVLEGELRFTFRGEHTTARAGTTIHIPANAPHQFKNESGKDARLLCLCATAAQEGFFREVGVPVATRTTPPPPMSKEDQEALAAKARAIAPQFRSELLPPEADA